MKEKKNDGFSDFWKITYREAEDFEKLMMAVDKLSYNGNIKMELLHNVPAPLDVLINEYDRDFQLEYRDITGPTRTKQNNINLLKQYLLMCENGDNLYIIDPYFFTSKTKNNYYSLLKQLFDGYDKRQVVVYYDAKNFEQDIFDYFNTLLANNNTNLLIKTAQDLHDRFYLSNKNFGFSMGASLNGFLNREGRISKLDNLEFNELYNKYKM